MKTDRQIDSPLVVQFLSDIRVYIQRTRKKGLFLGVRSNSGRSRAPVQAELEKTKKEFTRPSLALSLVFLSCEVWLKHPRQSRLSPKKNETGRVFCPAYSAPRLCLGVWGCTEIFCRRRGEERKRKEEKVEVTIKKQTRKKTSSSSRVMFLPLPR